MKVLLITFSFPPAGGVGVLRALSLARYLPENGIRVDVLSARNAPAVGRDLSLLQQVPESVTVHRTWTLDLPFAVRKRIKQMLSRRAGSAHHQETKNSADAARPRSFVQRTRVLIANLLLPDPQIGWLPFALPAAHRIIRSRNIDAVLVTVPPFSSARLVTQLRKSFPALPLILDFRDEWLTTTLSLVSFNNNDRARTVAEETESQAVHAATAVVAVTYAAADELRRRYPRENAEKFQCIPNGFDVVPVPEESPRPRTNSRVVFTYMGSIYGSTDPGSFLEAVSELPPEIRAQVLIRFIGHIETNAYRQALDAVSGAVETVGFLPQPQALQELRRSDYALLITHDPINVSAKFYDYIGSGIPILAAVHPHGEVRRLLEETQAGWWADIGDVAAIKQSLIDAVLRVQNSLKFQPNLALVAQYHRKPLAARYARLLAQIAGARA